MKYTEQQKKIKERMNAGDFLMPILRETIFEEKNTRAQNSIQKNEEEFIDAIQICSLEAFALHYYGKILSKKSRGILNPAAMSNMVRMLRMDAELKQIRDAMHAENIEFIPFKGADIAFRCYPLDSMRYMCDMDLLFHPEDLDHAIEILVRLGWNKTIESSNGYHVGALYKRGINIEPHHQIPFFPGNVQDELWKYTRTDEKRGLKIFSPEIVFLITFLHLEYSKWGRFSLIKFLLDIAFLLKNDPPDWETIAELEKRWNLPDARIFPKTFPTAIPDELVPNNPPINSELQKTYSYLIRNNFLFPHDRYEENLSSAKIFTVKWWRCSLNVFQPEFMRNKYKLPEDVSRIRLTECYIKDIFSKCKKLIHYFTIRYFVPETPESHYLAQLHKYNRIRK